jgi:lysine decarboxylase/arginine decarboxylase
VAIIARDCPPAGVAGQAISEIADELTRREYRVARLTTAADGQAEIAANAALDVILLEWELPDATAVLTALRKRNRRIPVYLLRDHDSDVTVPVEIMEEVNELVWLGEDTAPFIAGRIEASAQRYADSILPTFFKALVAFNDVHEYSWHTPGHTGGTAFLKTAAGLAFYDYFGESLLRSDLSISVDALGSLLDHSGPIGAGERYIAKVFGADRSYTVTNGTSTSNRMIYAANLRDGDVALCDRNCHKSIEQGLTQTGAHPVYLMPLRNYLGIIGPIPPAAIKSAEKQLRAGKLHPRLATVTNSTYDGICYNAHTVADLLGKTCDRIHFDEAWYGYARFNDLYREHFAMYGDAADYPDTAPTLFATQSTHKLLAALSQASYIHLRQGRAPVEHGRFNEAFMMHSSTSPLYTIIASNEISAAMMEEAGEFLTTESLWEACEFRQNVWRYKRELAEKGQGWFFETWNPTEVTDPATGRTYDFADAPLELLTTEQSCWELAPGAAWHGYGKLPAGYAMLDPIKVSVVTPGALPDGTLADTGGIPAMLLSAYLENKGIVCEKTADFTVLFLFSIGITNGKWGTLLNALLEFKRDYDANIPLEECVPGVVSAHHERYVGMGLRDLSDEMFAQIKRTRQTEQQSAAFSRLPACDLSCRDAYAALVDGRVEQVTLMQLAGRTLATGIVPYPPGIPLLMPGENAGKQNDPFIGYLFALQEFDRRFPGFEHDSHGVEVRGGTYYVHVIANA